MVSVLECFFEDRVRVSVHLHARVWKSVHVLWCVRECVCGVVRGVCVLLAGVAGLTTKLIPKAYRLKRRGERIIRGRK